MDEISSWLCVHHFPVLKSVRKPRTEDTNHVFGEKIGMLWWQYF